MILESLSINLPLLLAMVFIIALLYSSVGLGGGSAYTALLAIFGVAYTVIPGISLTLNLLVTFSGGINYIRRGHARLSLILPFILASIPMSYIGGRIHLSSHIFYLLLLISLIAVAIRIYAVPQLKMQLQLSNNLQILTSTGIGALLGFIAGAVGIGGGVYLIPLIIILDLGNEKEAAASGSVFIFVNSLAGIFGRFHSGNYQFMEIAPLAVTVVVGGFIGSYFGAGRLKPEIMKKLLGVVIIIAIVMLAQRMMLS
jgi:uncharacterized protein